MRVATLVVTFRQILELTVPQAVPANPKRLGPASAVELADFSLATGQWIHDIEPVASVKQAADLCHAPLVRASA